MEKAKRDKLKELAEKAKGGVWRFEPVEEDQSDMIAFINAASPSVILDMLEGYERLEKEADWLASQLEARDIADHYEDCLLIADMKDQTDWRKAAQEATKRPWESSDAV